MIQKMADVGYGILFVIGASFITLGFLIGLLIDYLLTQRRKRKYNAKNNQSR